MRQLDLDQIHDGNFVLDDVALEDVFGVRLRDDHAVHDLGRARSRRVAVADGADVRWTTVRLQFAAFKLFEQVIQPALAHVHGVTPIG